MQLEIVTASSGRHIAVLENLDGSTTIGHVKQLLFARDSKYYTSRQSLRLEPKGKSLSDELLLTQLDLIEDRLFFKDLGPQIGWSTVFLTEYAGPLLVYLILAARPAFIYGKDAYRKPRADVVWLATACWAFHYTKRILETLFVHRFSKSTMPFRNLFKNCGYYWGFAALIGYFISHPLFTPPAFGNVQMYLGLCGFIICEYGNFVIHCALRDLRPEGSTVRKIPYPTSNPMTLIFNLVSCPNYTYEIGAWICFTLMTQSFSVVLFVLAGFFQMAQWAQGKHKNYRKEFKDYPKSRKCIIPFVL